MRSPGVFVKQMGEARTIKLRCAVEITPVQKGMTKDQGMSKGPNRNGAACTETQLTQLCRRETWIGRGGGFGIVQWMSAAEIIEEIKRLPADKRQEVKAFLDRAEEVRFASDEEAAHAGEEVIEEYSGLLRKLAQ
jgi:hypothetical protein